MTFLATGTISATGSVDPVSVLENALIAWVVAGSGLPASQVILASAGGQGGPSPSGPYISLRILGIDRVSADWLIPRRVNDQIVLHLRGTRHPTLELRCYAGSSYGLLRAEQVLTRTLAAARLPSIAAGLRAAGVGLSPHGRVRVAEGRRSGMFDPLAIVEVPLHVMLDIAEPGQSIERVEGEVLGRAYAVNRP